MAFTTYRYLVFLVIAVILGRGARGAVREWILLILSFIFYASWDPRYVPLLLGLGLFTYFAVRSVAAHKGKRIRLALSVVAVLLVLGLFKYTGMVVEGLNLALPKGRELRVPSFVLPLGISFFTFEC